MLFFHILTNLSVGLFIATYSWAQKKAGCFFSSRLSRMGGREKS
jgi:hypothetical protein